MTRSYALWQILSISARRIGRAAGLFSSNNLIAIRSFSGRVVEDDPEGVAAARSQPTHAVTEVHAIRAARARDWPMVNGKAQILSSTPFPVFRVFRTSANTAIAASTGAALAPNRMGAKE
jgi:hypothetical protein